MRNQKLSCRQGNAQDAITILMTAPGHTASKRFVKTATGVEKIGFNAGLYFGVMEPQVVGDIYGLSDVLMAIEPYPNMLVIRGLPANDAFVGNGVRRTGSGDVGNFFTPPAGHHWILIDFDKIKIPKCLSLKRNPVAVCEHLVGLLPAEFHSASYHWQLSSSAGMGEPDEVSMHIWFWLMRPVPDQDLKAWGAAVNDKVGYKLIDTALFQHVQAHYTAAPLFEGMPDPFATRSGLHTKTQDAVDLVLPEAMAQPARGTVGSGVSLTRAASGAGFEYHLSRIGDHPGGDGFHGPIVAAVASYVATHGEDGTDREALYQAVRERVLSADARNHDPVYIEHMASREHIESAIESAIRKYGAAPARRKASLHEGVQGGRHRRVRRAGVEVPHMDQHEACRAGWAPGRLAGEVAWQRDWKPGRRGAGSGAPGLVCRSHWARPRTRLQWPRAWGASQRARRTAAV